MLASVVNVTLNDDLAATTALNITFVKVDGTFSTGITVTTNTIMSKTFFNSGVSPLSSAYAVTSSIINVSLFRRVHGVVCAAIPT